MPVSDIRSEKDYELFRCVTSVHVQGEYAAVFSKDGSGQSLQLYRVVFPDGAIASQEIVDGRSNWENIVGVDIEGAGGPVFEMNS